MKFLSKSLLVLLAIGGLMQFTPAAEARHVFYRHHYYGHYAPRYGYRGPYVVYGDPYYYDYAPAYGYYGPSYGGLSFAFGGHGYRGGHSYYGGRSYSGHSHGGHHR